MTDVKDYQRDLNTNESSKRHFIDADADDESEDSDQNEVRIIAPVRNRKKGHLDEMVMEQLLAQQRAYIKAQKRICKLQTEIDTEEVRTRYLKLDLNNAQVKADEEKETRLKVEKELYNAHVENWVFRLLMVLFMFATVYSKMM